MLTAGRHIVLMGLRGAGKSTLAHRLARRLDVASVDLDDVVLSDLGAATVDQAWRDRGEPAFRAAEAAALRRLLLGTNPTVIALGGGTPTVPDAAAALRKASAEGRACTIYLHAPPKVLARRLSPDDPNRPSLTGAPADEEAAAVYAERDVIYRALADHVIDAGRAADRVADAAMLAVGRRSG